MTVRSQRKVDIHKEQHSDKFLYISIDELRAAQRVLNYSAFKLYLYLAGNADGHNLELSQKAVESAIGIKKTAYHDAVRKLKELGYLVGEQGNRLDFFTRPVRFDGGDKEDNNCISFE